MAAVEDEELVVVVWDGRDEGEGEGEEEVKLPFPLS